MADTYDTIKDTVESMITNAKEYADEAITTSFSSISDAMEQTNNINWVTLNTNPSSTVNWPDNLSLPFTKGDIPTLDQNTFQYLNLYQNDWLEKYRLIMSENFADLISFNYAEKKLESILQTGIIIDKTVQDQIINRAIDQEISQFNQARDQVNNDWVSKGWNIPSSFQISRLDNLQRDLDNKISSVNRDYVIKNQDLYVDMTKFAIQVSTELLPKCVDIASAFAGRYSQIYNYGAENVKNYLTGLGVVNDSIRNYHNTLVSRVQTGLQETQSWRNYDLDAKNKQVQFELQKVKFHVDSTLTGAQLLATIGNAALSANNSIISLSASAFNNATSTNIA